jgi:hypothetical protein
MNNRPLKFRVWDKLEKRFIYPDKGYQGHYVLDLNGRFQNLQNGSGGDEYVVQQWTGFVDEKGVDVYEGDFLEDSRTPITFNDGKFVVAVGGARIFDLEEFWENGRKPEVFGNIFELPCNPDHNGECLVCDEPLDGCPFLKEK